MFSKIILILTENLIKNERLNIKKNWFKNKVN